MDIAELMQDIFMLRDNQLVKARLHYTLKPVSFVSGAGYMRPHRNWFHMEPVPVKPPQG